MSAVEEDISAALDDIEMENLVSLLQDDTVFDDLNKLDLPSYHNGFVGTDSHETDSNDVDLLDFHDALDFFTNGNTEPNGDLYLSSAPAVMNSSFASNPTPTAITNGDLNDIQMSSDILNELFCTNSGPINLSPPTTAVDTLDSTTSNLAVSQASVHHDHTYATREPIDDASMLTISSDNSSSGKNSDTEEGNTSDTGYDTMTTSPASSRSSFSSPQQSSVSQSLEATPTKHPLHPSTNGADFTQLVTDPVKLIDERIKFFMSRQEVQLTEEEMETLRSEGLPIPTTLPLTRTEEKALKTVRRKIKNKLAAQESRKKKKEYMHCLEEQVQQCTKENRKLHKKVETLETENRTLLQQLAHLQALVARANPILGRQVNIGTCLMVVVLCFGVLFGNLLPYRVSMATADYTTSAVRSRALLSMDSTSKWTNWVNFYKVLLPSNSGHSHLKHNDNDGTDYNAGTIMNSLWFYCGDNSSTHSPLIS